MYLWRLRGHFLRHDCAAYRTVLARRPQGPGGGAPLEDMIRALFGRAYCGVVCRPGQHKFAVFGPSVKLATHTIVSKDNPMILIEKNVHLLKSLVFFRTIMWPSLVPQETGSGGGQ